MKTFLLACLRRGTKNARAEKPPEPFFPEHDKDGFRQVAFRFAVIALAAKLAEADGKTGAQEMQAFEALFPLAGEAQGKARQLFAMACEDGLPASHYARQVRRLYPENEKLRRELVVRLRALALADGPIVPAEEQWLDDVAAALGVPAGTVESMLPPSNPAAASDPYRVLGVTKKASSEEIKRAYYRRIRELHPDSLAANGHDAQAIEEAGGALASVNDAYGAIARKQKIK
jgi:DnaJ-domain-containing protein 1